MTEISLQELLARLGRETGALAERSARIDAVIGARGGAHDPVLQDIDLLRQSLEDLSRFVQTLAAEADCEPRIELHAATATLRLGALRQRLSGNADQPAAPPGNLDLF